MESIILSNPIYQHSGETEKDSCIAQQACINEEQEQRRRQLDTRGEKQKVIVAKEVAHMVDEFGGRISLKETPYHIPSEPILQQASQAASNVFTSALEAGKNFFNSATSAVSSTAEKVTDTAKGVADSAVHMGQDAAAYVSHAAQEAAHQASDISKKVVDTTSNAAHEAANQASLISKKVVDTTSSAAHEAANQASLISKKVVDTTSSAAGAVTQKTKEFAEGAANKAYEIADNINHFTTLVSVLAEEENERARRLVSGDEARAAANAFRVSELIRDLGFAFYKQTPNLNYATKILEEAERRWRLNSSYSSVAETNAHNLGKLVSGNLQSFTPRYEWARVFISGLEEKERTRRLNDPAESYAMLNAFWLSERICDLGLGFYRQEGTFSSNHKSYATTLLEELERRDRIREYNLTHARDNSTLLMDVVANNMEKFNYSTRHAAQFANDHMPRFLSYLNRWVHLPPRFEFATMVGSATKNIAANFTALTQDLAKTAATRVKSAAGDLANYSTLMYVIALEERERARRIADPSEINAINNAWIQSGLIRQLEGLYRSSHRATYPLGLVEEQERVWRVASLSPSSARKVADIVRPNLLKFELAAARCSKIEHAMDTAAHSKLNPNAPAFVPHQVMSKPEQAPIQTLASGAGIN